jgi:hypothetical protein
MSNHSHKALRDIPRTGQDTELGIAEVDDARERLAGLKTQ